VLTTGKTLTAATPHRHALDLVSFPTCTLNGNVVYDPSGKIIQEFMLPVTVVEEVYAKCRAAGVNLFLFDRENAYHVLPFKTFTDAQGDRLLSKYGENIVHIRHAATVLQKVRAGAVNVISMAICEAEAYIPRTL
jgi:hydroxymethylpyrimidine pyrophosphatase-like HAD family hydrolase